MIGQNVKKIRNQKGISLEELANKLGINKGTLSNYENNKRDMSIEKASQIADSLGVTLTELITGIIYEENKEDEQSKKLDYSIRRPRSEINPIGSEVIIKLTQNEIKGCYLMYENMYAVQDATMVATTMLCNNEITKNDVLNLSFRGVAKEYLENHDNNVDDFSQLKNIIRKHIERLSK